jgi:hypothetical protein
MYLIIHENKNPQPLEGVEDLVAIASAEWLSRKAFGRN